ncbi:hypothetical protein VOLCADRAFT_108227 [Volvox carteri f. nagariensis]|uniref:NF-kappa-B inhibitor-like protein 1 n=1 Tax=Volvox carteri f. nagariensis TaxID=3068 RepID=D8UIZ9_VOLCA|nr:uncharacterized protein VOLCADRAFT_108227 [Volvox carteri f. nagariensis]EFJ40308.1 hypothetical protein VOLCADRAFT_108227 [Volvox carteri f. nagariensis]|eukprot:XP_002958642.1 hypothetical protein VOLCADRAFT_108227 [Volvox carteri f. nagariensis]
MVSGCGQAVPGVHVERRKNNISSRSFALQVFKDKLNEQVVALEQLQPLRLFLKYTRLAASDLRQGDREGRTLLHHACICGHAGAVSILLRHGAPTTVLDTFGDTPAHLAARSGHLEALAEVLQRLLACEKAPDAPPLESTGSCGTSLRDLIGRALHDGGAGDPAKSGGQGSELGVAVAGPGDDAAGCNGQESPEEGGESEDEDVRWRRRLREELSDGEETVSDGWNKSAAGLPVCGESDDDWADRIWQEMCSRRSAAAAASAAAFTADLRAETTRRAAEAEERSRRILQLTVEASWARALGAQFIAPCSSQFIFSKVSSCIAIHQEEKAKDANWRRRTLAAIEAGPAAGPLDLTAARVAYDARWAQLDQEAAAGAVLASPPAPLRYSDIPWPLEPTQPTPAGQSQGVRGGAPPPPPPPPSPPSAEALRNFLLLGATGPSDVKRRLRAELLRWHPDKFGARFGARLAAAGPAQREAALIRVQQLAQVLTQASDPANFDLAFNFVAQNVAELGRSIDIRAAEDWFDSLARRCDVDSQCGKAARVRALVAEIKCWGSSLKSDYDDPEYRILTLLMLLAERPLDTSVEHAAALVRQVREQQLADEAAAKAQKVREEAELLALIRAEASSDSDEELAGAPRRGGRGGYYGSPSSLSDWSEDERAGAVSAEAGSGTGGPAAHRRSGAMLQDYGSSGSVVLPTPPSFLRPGALGVASAGVQAASPKPAPVVTSPREPSGQLQTQFTLQALLQPQQSRSAVAHDPPASAGRQRLPPRRLLVPSSSLRARLVTAAGLPLRVAGEVTPLPRVLLALLAALQGRSSEEISWDPVNCSFVAADDLYLAADVSFGAVRSAVRSVIRASTAVRRLDDWVQTCLLRHCGGGAGSTPGNQTAGGGSGTAAGGRKPPASAPAASAVPGGGAPVVAGGGSWPAGSLEVPAWLLTAADVKGRTGLRLVQGPTLQALHQAVSSCLHALRIPLVELEQRVTTAAASAAAAGGVDGSRSGLGPRDPATAAPPLPSLYELLLSCQPFMRRAAGLVAAYLEVAKPLVTQLAAAPPLQASAAAISSDVSPAPRVSSVSPAPGGPASAPSAAATPAAGAGGRSVALQLQAGLVLERLHAMNERGWLDGVFRPLESHAHRCMVLYLYLCALEPLLDGLSEWLWNSGTGPAAAAAAAAGAVGGAVGTGPTAAGAGAGASELPADFFIVRGGGPGREVPPDHPAFWREGYAALIRPQPSGPAAGAAGAGGAGSHAAGASAAAAAAAHYGPSYLCPSFLEPLVPIIMAAGKSLRLRQREADSMEAAATTTAGAAGPGYGSAGSAVLDPVALEESYALYGLDPEYADTVYGRRGGWISGRRDLKRGLMERLMSYIASSGQELGAGAGLGPSGLQGNDETWAPVGAGGMAPAVAPTQMRPTASFRAATASACVAAGPGGLATTAATAEGGVAAAGGLWTRMATASARLRSLCLLEDIELGDDSPGRSASDRGGSGRLNGAGGRETGVVGMPATAIRRVRAPRPAGVGRTAEVGSLSPVSPLDCGGASGISSPDEAAAARQQHQQQHLVDHWVEEVRSGGWLPRRCELLLRSTAEPASLLVGVNSCGGGHGCSSGGSRGLPLAGPWHRIHQQLRAGPRAALEDAAAAHDATGRSSRLRGLLGRGGDGGVWSWSRSFAANAYQHPALDLLLMHACGQAPPPGPPQFTTPDAVEPTAAAKAVGGAGEWTGAGCAAMPGSPAKTSLAGGGAPLGLPHPQELLRQGLVEPLQDRAYHVNDALLLKLLSGWGLETRLMALPAVFLLSSPAVRSWADRLVSALLSGMRLGERPLEEQQLESMLQEALASADPDDVLPTPSSLVLTLTPVAGQEAAGAAGSAAAGAAGRTAGGKAGGPGGQQQEPAKFQVVQELDRSVAELDRLQLSLAPSWVVALIADTRVLKAYSHLRWVRTALNAAHKSSYLAWKERETRAHPNSWKPLRSGGGGAGRAPPPLQRTVSAGIVDAAVGQGVSAAAAAGVRGSTSSNSLLGGPAAAAARNAPGSASTSAGGAGGSSSSASSAARLQSSLAAMVHFMATLEQWVATQLVHDAWVQLMTDLNAARNLDDVCEAHTAYTVTLLRRCFRYAGEEGSRHMGAALRKCLDACLRFAAAVSSLTGGGAAKVMPGGAAAGGAAQGPGPGGVLPNPLTARLQDEAHHAASQFSYWLGYLVRFVSTRALLSPSSDLGDLLMRLNYNDCYSAHFMPEELVAQQLAAQHCATAAARGWAALGPARKHHPINKVDGRSLNSLVSQSRATHSSTAKCV